MPTIRLTRLGALYLTVCALVLAAALWPQPARAQAVNANLSIDADAAGINAGDAVLFATGREPNTRGIGLEAAGVKTDKGGAIRVDGRSRTTEVLRVIQVT